MTREQVEIRRLAGDDLSEQLDALAAVLHDCVAGGASVSYMAPFSHDGARYALRRFAAAEAEQGRLILAAFAGDELVGTVQVILALPPNQPHRGEIAKLLVHRSARGRGIARQLMERAEAEAGAEGRTLLVLDAVTDGAAGSMLASGWTRGRRRARLRALPGRPALHDVLLQGALMAQLRPRSMRLPPRPSSRGSSASIKGSGPSSPRRTASPTAVTGSPTRWTPGSRPRAPLEEPDRAHRRQPYRGRAASSSRRRLARSSARTCRSSATT